MSSKLIQLEQRIRELEELAKEVVVLAEKLSTEENIQPELSIKGQRWYRGAREVLAQNGFSGLADFEACYDTSKIPGTAGRYHTDIETYLGIGTNTYRAEKLWSSLRVL